ncbi:MAG: type IV toxin-antitoxin system AbiEi family antitoxin domain-containing protein [Candidatus Micrarchaeaceae archaeon]
MIYKRRFSEYFSRKPFFTFNEAERYLSREGATEGYCRLLLHNMVKKNELVRIKKGFYTFSRNEVVSGFAFRPFHYGLEYALSIRKTWTQQSIPVVVTTSKANPGIRDVLGYKILVRRISEKYFFGFEYLNYSNFFIPVSTPEKTALDFLYYGIKLDPETLHSLLAQSDPLILKDYASKPGIRELNSTVQQFFRHE